MWLELALQVKVGKVTSFVGKMLVVRPSTTKTTNILLHENYPLYGIALASPPKHQHPLCFHFFLSYGVFSDLCVAKSVDITCYSTALER